MKNIIFTLSFVFVSALCVAQIKVVSSGDTGVGEANPTTKLHVTNNGSNEVAKFESDACAAQLLFNATGTGGKEWLFMSTADCASLGGGKYTVFERGVAHQFVIAPGGNVGLGTTSPNTRLHVNGVVTHGGLSGPSDARLKTNIKELRYGLKEILQLQPKTYNWNGRAGMTNDKLQIGVLAQDIQKVIPEAVSEWTYVDALDNKSINKDNDRNFLAIQTDALQYVLVNAIKEQQQIISENKETINSLQDQVNLLEEKLNELISTETKVEISDLETGKLDQNIPNPYNNLTTISYVIPEKSDEAKMLIFDNSGRLVKEVEITHIGKGNLTVNAGELSSGIYNYQLVIDGKVVDSKRMTLTK